MILNQMRIGISSIARRKPQSVRHFFKFGSKNTDTGYYDIVKPAVVSRERPVPDHIQKPTYYYEGEQPDLFTSGKSEIKRPPAIAAMKKSCKLAANILNKCSTILKPGLTTDEIDEFVHNETIASNAYPSPLRYAEFPKSVCTSVNNVACHGIPDSRPLLDGDIINVDITVYFEGYHGDCSKTFMIGNVDPLGRHLVKVTEECLHKGIAVCGPNVPFSAIGAAIEAHAHENGLEVFKEFIGHGIGQYFHGKPEICHYRNEYPGNMMPGMTFTIEPILCLGYPSYRICADDWTAVTKDDSRAAQFEHTILITTDGVEILTVPHTHKIADQKH